MGLGMWGEGKVSGMVGKIQVMLPVITLPVVKHEVLQEPGPALWDGLWQMLYNKFPFP